MRLLGITAHPDDEVGAFGGTLLFYNSRKIETYVICLTPGQAATYRGNARSDEELAEIRRAEFKKSCSILQVKEAQILDYPDGGLDRIDFLTVVGDLTFRIRKIQPHLILTLGPEGAITGHPDHSMAAIYATMAFHWAARKDRFPEQLQDGLTPHAAQKLYYATTSFILPDRPPAPPSPWTASIDIAPFMESKILASREHATQSPLMKKFRSALKKFGSTELFHLAASVRPKKMEIETDLLSDISE